MFEVLKKYNMEVEENNKQSCVYGMHMHNKLSSCPSLKDNYIMVFKMSLSK